MRRLMAKDQCIQRLLRELKKAEATALPTRGEIEAQKKIAALELQKANQLQVAAQRREATVSMVKAQLHQRTTTLQEREEGKKVRAIRRLLSPAFRPPIPDAPA